MPEKDEINELIQKNNTDELLRRIKNGDFSTKNRILDGLKETKNDDTVDLLIELLQDDSVAFKAAHLLGEIGTKRATKPLIALLGSKDRIIQGNTIDALAKIKDKRAVKPIMEMLDGDPWIQNRAVEALYSFQTRALDDILKEFGTQEKPNPLLFYVLEQMKGKPIPKLMKSLESNNPLLRGNAVYALRAIGSGLYCDDKTAAKLKESATQLVKLLSDDSEFVRGNAALALGGLKETGICEQLQGLLADKDSYPRAMAARALGIVGDDKAVNKLLKLLRDPSVEVQKNAIFSLGKLGSLRSVEQILPFLTGREKELRIAAIKSLSMIGDESSASKIADLLSEDDNDIQIEVLKSLRELNYTDTLSRISQVLNDDNAEVRKLAVGLLGRIGGEEVVAPLTKALKDKDEGVVRSAARAIRELGDESFIDPLVGSIKKNKSFNYEIIKTIREIGDQDALKKAMTKTIKVGEYDLLTGGIIPRVDKLVLSTVKDLLDNRSRKFQLNALNTVRDFEKKIVDEPLISKVVGKLTSPDTEVVHRAAEAVKSIGVPAAIPLANIMAKTTEDTKQLIFRIFSDVQGLHILNSMEGVLKQPTRLAKTVTKEGLSLFERLLGVVENTIAEGTKEITKLGDSLKPKLPAEDEEEDQE